MTLSPAILAERRGRITSSVAAGALGLNPRMSPLDAWMRVTGRLPPVPETKAMRRGNRLEKLVLEYPAEELGLVCLPAPFRLHPTLEWAADSADALYFDPRSLDNYDAEDVARMTAKDVGVVLADGVVPLYLGEGKTAAQGVAADFGEEGTDDVPAGALVQSHWHHIFWPNVAKRMCLVPVLVGGYEFEFRTYLVARDDAFEGALLDDLAKWHRDYVVGDKPPPAMRPEDTEHLLSLIPNPTRGMAEPTPEIEALVFEKHEAALAKAAAEAREESAKLRLRELLAEFEGVSGDGWSVRYKRNRPSYPVDWEAIARELGADDNDPLIKRHTTERVGNRPLVVTVKE